MARRYVTSRTPRSIPEGKNPPAERGVVRTYAKLMKPNDQYASLLDEVDVEVRQWGKKDYRVSAGSMPVGQGTYKDFGAANAAFRDYIEKKKDAGWKVLNERQSFKVER